jgi:hypothetical protein
MKSLLMRGVVILFLAAASDVRAAIGDPIFRSSFESCSTEGITPASFLERMRAAADGRSGCIAPTSGSFSGLNYTVCATSTCGGAPGCTVVMRASNPLGNFMTGAFQLAATADDMTVPVQTTGLITTQCTLQFSQIIGSHDFSYGLTALPPDGTYVAAMNLASSRIDDYTRSGCGTLAAVLSTLDGFLQTMIASAIADAIAPAVADATVGHSVCPLP